MMMVGMTVMMMSDYLNLIVLIGLQEGLGVELVGCWLDADGIHAVYALILPRPLLANYGRRRLEAQLRT